MSADAAEAAGVKGPIGGVATDPTYLDIALEKGATFSHRRTRAVLA